MSSTSSNNTYTTVLPDEAETVLASRTQFTVIAVIYLIICLLGIVGNSLVIAAVALCRKLQTATNVFVVSLAITDLLSCLTLPFQAIMFLSPDAESRLLSDGLCAFVGAVTIICLMGSILLLALIAINRCFLITQPRKNYAWLYTTKKLVVMTSLAWLYPLFFLVLPQALGVGQLGYSPDYKACLWNEHHPLAFVSDILVAVTFFFTFLIIVVCYIKIWCYIHHHVRRLRYHSSTKSTPSEPSHNLDELSSTQDRHTDTPGPSSTGSKRLPLDADNANGNANANGYPEKPAGSTKKLQRTRSVSAREIEITKNLFYVVCAFFLCIIPYTITLTLPRDPILDLLVLYASVPLVCNGCVNPIIYAYKHPTMRVVFRYILRCQIGSIPKPSGCLRRLLSVQQGTEPGTRGEGQIWSADMRPCSPAHQFSPNPNLSFTTNSKRESPIKHSSHS